MFNEYELLKDADRLTDIGKGEDAVKVLRRLQEGATEDFLMKEGAKVAELFGAAFGIKGDAPKAAAAYLDAANKDRFLRAQRGHISSYLFILHYLENIETNALYGELANYEKLFCDFETLTTKKFIHQKIRVGYLLPTLKKSSLSNFVAPMFTKFNQDKFEVYVYTFKDTADTFANEVKKSVNSLKLLDSADLFNDAKTIAEDEIDILVDLSAHGSGGDTLSILAYRPAKVQIVGIGWPSVLNLSFVDYVLADDFLIDDFFSDKPLILPQALVFRPDKTMLKSSASHKENNDLVTFGVFNNFMKITDEALCLWKEILMELSNARLYLKDSCIYEERIGYMEDRLRKIGISEKTTVKIADENYLDDLKNIDIILDTFPYTGGFMTAAAVTLGVPVITLAGERFSSKFSADILRIANLDEFITYDKYEYKLKALKLAKNPYKDFDVKNRALKSGLFDEEFYMKNLETAYEKLLQ